MTGFIVGAAVLLTATALLLGWPAWSGRRSAAGGAASADAGAEVVAAYRSELAELQADLAAGTLSADRFDQSRRELQQRLLAEVDAAAATSPGSGAASTGLAAARAPRWAWAAALAFVVLLPIGLYAKFGVPEALEPGAATRVAARDGAAGPITAQQVEAMVSRLEQHLKEAPGDSEGWTMLARTYNFMRRFPEASTAYARAVALVPDDAQLLADYADALAMAHDRSLAGEPMTLVERALKIDPQNAKALALAGTNAFEKQDYAGAVAYWERSVKASPQDGEFAAALQASIAEARSRGGLPSPVASASAAKAATADAAVADSAAGPGAAPPAQARIRGRVTLASAVASRAAPDDTVFVFARAEQGPRMPVALLRRQVKDLPLDFTLDDGNAMMPQLSLSKVGSVVVGARVSRSGNATPQSGDLHGESAPVKVGTDGVRIEISQIVP